MAEYFSSKNIANCQIWYFEKMYHKVNKVKNQQNFMT